MNTQEKLDKVTEIAKESYDGHFTLMRFTTNWRLMYGTVNSREDITNSFVGETLDEVLDEAIGRLRLLERLVEEGKQVKIIHDLENELKEAIYKLEQLEANK